MNPNHKIFKDQKKKKKKKTILSPRSPLQHLNYGVAARTGSMGRSTSIYTDAFAASSSSSSSLSTEAASSSSSSSGTVVPKPQILSTTPSKSVYNSKTARIAPSCFRSNKSVKVNRLKRHNSNIASKLKKKKTLEEVKTTLEHAFTFTLTPAANNKLVRIDEEEDSTSTTKNTPPVQISVSPEIQGGLLIYVNASATPSCYGAGHLVSGVTDRRKCRPRGILAVESKSGCINGENKADLHEFSTSSLVMEPLEASMRWLCNNGDQQDIPGLFSLYSPSSAQEIYSTMCKSEKFRVATPSCEVVTLQEKKGNNWSPFSIDSLCSDNMIQTPESDSIFNHYNKGDDHNLDIQSAEDSTGNRCSIDCSSMKELFGSKLSLSLRDGINQFEEGPNYSRSLSDDDECRKFDFSESFGFGVMKGEEPIPPQHKASIFAESLTINGDSISDMFSRCSTHS